MSERRFEAIPDYALTRILDYLYKCWSRWREGESESFRDKQLCNGTVGVAFLTRRRDARTPSQWDGPSPAEVLGMVFFGVLKEGDKKTKFFFGLCFYYEARQARP